jgi:uncharacterized protein (DUF1330 family)
LEKVMKTQHTVALSVLAGVAVGVAAVQVIHAQTAKPPVYILNETEVTDPAGFQAYAEAQSKMIQKHGGRYIIRNGKTVATIAGAPPTGRITVYVFDNQDKMQAWRDDPAQKDVLGTRDKVGKFRSIAVEGLTN